FLPCSSFSARCTAASSETGTSRISSTTIGASGDEVRASSTASPLMSMKNPFVFFEKDNMRGTNWNLAVGRVTDLGAITIGQLQNLRPAKLLLHDHRSIAVSIMNLSHDKTKSVPAGLGEGHLPILNTPETTATPGRVE